MKAYFFWCSVLFFIAMSPGFGQIPNGDFESWSDGVPDSWCPNNGPGVAPITQTTFTHSGNYAVKGTVLSWNGSDLTPWLASGPIGEGFTIDSRPSALHGFYAFIKVSPRDTFRVMVEVSRNDTLIGSGSYSEGTGVSMYQEFVANIHYVSDSIPTLVRISFGISNYGAPFDVPGSYFFLDDVSFDSPSGVERRLHSAPTGYLLSQNYPNPFNPTTNFELRIANCGFVSLRVFDVLGREVAALMNEVKQPGEYNVVWDASKMPSGTYFYRLQAGEFTEAKKLMIVR